MELTVKRTSDGQLLMISSYDYDSNFFRESDEYTFILENSSKHSLLSMELYVNGYRQSRDILSDSIIKWVWSTGFYSGEVAIELTVNNKQVVLSKIYINTSVSKLIRKEYDVMLKDIFSAIKTIYSLSNIDKSMSHSFNAERFPFLFLANCKQYLSALQSSIMLISKNAKTNLDLNEKRQIDVSKARRITPGDLNSSFRRGVAIDKHGRYIPSKVWESPYQDVHNIYEHRYLLGKIIVIISAINRCKNKLNELNLSKRRAGSKVAEGEGDIELWILRAEQYKSVLSSLTRLHMFQNVTPSKEDRGLTSIFQKANGYKESYSLLKRFFAGVDFHLKADVGIPVARTYDLYEVWCFVKILSVLTNNFGYSIPDLSSLFVRDDKGIIPRLKDNLSITINIASGKSISFQRTFKPFSVSRADSIISYSVEMRPDITLEENKGNKSLVLVILDAKYRVASSLNEAIADLHKYKDSIISTEVEINKKAFILSPYVIGGLRSDDWKDIDKMPDRLLMTSYKSNFDFGIYSFKPGLDDGYYSAVVEEMLK
ncbi:DUF2357 domain-containing protein [Hymenobacter yonginensis]|uniref:DUF2357 domain-containing protein n=1 Tax=Hymenobacter yonginensis TaxID=748197 RepID=A0ABY7PUU6_9BACT|nr:DUF2357 domain-containing protein [Hymenobacter yonginensis]WBO86407.1 DUF2357 domain-containing protein [Hymenobacter yonginensis]